MLGVEPRSGGVATPWFELDASGKDKGHPDAAGATGRVTVWGARGTRSAVIFDVDGDGDLDIVTNEFNARADGARQQPDARRRGVRYLEVKLTGTTSNRDGLGAVVKVTAGGTTYTKVMDGNSGYLSHSLYPLYFGLGVRRRGRQHRGAVAVGQEADRSAAVQAQFADRRARAVSKATALRRSQTRLRRRRR